MSAIAIKNLTFAYEKELLFENQECFIEEGEFLGIIGPNGGGKSTFLKLILGFLTPQKGSIFLFGKKPEIFRHLIGYVPQKLKVDLSFPLSLLEMVLLGSVSQTSLINQSVKPFKKRALDLLEEFELLPFKDHPFYELSGGQLQRALLARALLLDPKMLILDEVTACIDPKGEKGIFDLLISYKGKKTILLVSHNLNLIMKESKRVLSIHRSLEFLEPKEVCHHFSFGLSSEPPTLPKKL